MSQPQAGIERCLRGRQLTPRRQTCLPSSFTILLPSHRSIVAFAEPFMGYECTVLEYGSDVCRWAEGIDSLIRAGHIAVCAGEATPMFLARQRRSRQTVTTLRAHILVLTLFTGRGFSAQQLPAGEPLSPAYIFPPVLILSTGQRVSTGSQPNHRSSLQQPVCNYPVPITRSIP